MFRDITGKEILVGDTVVYAARRGSSVWLNKCKIVRIDPDKGLVIKRSTSNKTYYYKSMSSLAIIEDTGANS